MTQEKDDAERGTSGFLRNLHVHSSRCSMERDINKHFMYSCHNLKQKKKLGNFLDFLDTAVVYLVI